MNNIKGKNFSLNNVNGKRRKSDFYETPYSLTQLLLDTTMLKKTTAKMERTIRL